MTPKQADAILVDIQAVTAAARALTAGRSAERLMRRPRTEAWSAAETLEHLILTADAMLPLAASAVDELERTGRRASGAAGLGLSGWLLVKALEPPPRMKSRTAKPFEPVDVPDPVNVADRFAVVNARFEAVVKRSAGLDTARARVVSPFNAKVRYNVYAAFRIMLAHARRHLWQAAEADRAAA